MDRWTWINAKLGLIVWATLYFFQPPTVPVQQLGRTLNDIAAVLTITGTIISLFGLLTATRPSRRKLMLGYRIEISGLIVAVCGPATYCIAQLAAGSEVQGAYSRAAIAYTIAAFMLARCIMVRRAMRRIAQ